MLQQYGIGYKNSIQKCIPKQKEEDYNNSAFIIDGTQIQIQIGSTEAWL